MLHHIELLKNRVDALNVTDHQSSVMRFPSLGGCLAVKEKGRRADLAGYLPRPQPARPFQAEVAPGLHQKYKKRALFNG